MANCLKKYTERQWIRDEKLNESNFKLGNGEKIDVISS